MKSVTNDLKIARRDSLLADPSMTKHGQIKTKGDQRRVEILHAIRSYIRKHKEGPTVQEIQDMTRIRSFNTVSRHLIQLRNLGYIHWEPDSPVIQLNEEMVKV